jgi:hypothetical protein
MRKRTHRIFAVLTMLITCAAGLVLVTVLSGREAVPTKSSVASVQEQASPERNIVEAAPLAEPASASEQNLLTINENGNCGLCEYLYGIEISRYDEEYEIYPRTFENISKHPANVDLDLGESIENQYIFLRAANSELEFKVEQQFETSLTVSNEGPHLDLTDWKHYRSEWREIRKLERNKFLILKVSDKESTRFPDVTMQEVRREIARSGDTKWVGLAAQAKTVNDSPLSVGVSKISLRIKVKEDGQWKIIKRLNFTNPMGC